MFGYQISFIEDEQERDFFILYTCKNCIVLWGDSGGSINYKYSNALIRLDFPALRLPKIPICVRSEEGVLFKLMMYSSLSDSYV